jgi:hypothetical protein
MSRSDSRRQERAPSRSAVKLRWHDASGGAHFARGKILNCSDGGLCLELVEPIKPLSYVSLDAPELKRSDWATGGSVRHCTSKGAKYFVGIELKSGAQWD